MTARLTGLRDRPIGERERRGALAIVLVLLIIATALLLLTRPAPHRATTRHATATVTIAAPPHAQTPMKGAPSDDTPSPAGQAPSPAVASTSRAFLTGYLAYIYGRAPASQIKNITPALIASLQAHPPRVSPAMREHVPRIVGLHAVHAPAGLIGVQALINDGGLIDYPIGLLLKDQGGLLLVSEVDGEG
jgi:hypothetical protein